MFLAPKTLTVHTLHFYIHHWLRVLSHISVWEVLLAIQKWVDTQWSISVHFGMSDHPQNLSPGRLRKPMVQLTCMQSGILVLKFADPRA